MNDHATLFERLAEEWRTTPTDLGGWANRATQMKALAERLALALEEVADGAERHNPGWWVKRAKAALSEVRGA